MKGVAKQVLKEELFGKLVEAGILPRDSRGKLLLLISFILPG